jgi:signal transduction histidine kinase
VKVALKFTLAFLGALIVGLSLFGLAIIRREKADFEDSKHATHVTIARTLLPALKDLWLTNGEGEVIEAVATANEGFPHKQIRWVSLDPTAAAELQPETLPSELGALPDDVKDAHSILRNREGQPWIYTYAKITGPGGQLRAIEIKEALSHERELVEEAIFEQLIALGGVALLAVFASVALGIVIVGRPIQKLSEQARRVGAGDLSTRLKPPGGDEIAQLGREMDVMCDELVSAKERAETEALARGQALEQLRHGERLMTVGALASGMAHELGTPLNVVAMRAKLIASGEVETVEAKESGRIIAEQAARITSIMRQLLDFARRRSPQKSLVDLAGVVQRVVTFLAPVAQKSGVTVEVEGGPLMAMVDPAQIEQVLTNLVVNGIQAMDGSAEQSVLRIEISTQPKDGVTYASIAVTDRGVGITKEHEKRIFEPFFTTKEVGRGTGLGLSVAYGIVTEHKGFIDVESTVGEGSTFRVLLPQEGA